MKHEVVPLLRDPGTGEPLELVGGHDGAWLVSVESGRRFPIRDGIPVFLDPGDLTGPNGRYQRLYDEFAGFYDLATRLYALVRRTREETRRREYLDRLEIASGDRVLEVSVGTGANLPLLPRGASVFGVDISSGMLRRCRRRARRHDLDVRLFLGAAERLPFRDAIFDSVFHVGGINFFTDKARSLAEMVRVAKPGTRIVIVDETEDFAARHEAGFPGTHDRGAHAENARWRPSARPRPVRRSTRMRGAVPYSDLVGARDALAILAETPGRIEEIVRGWDGPRWAVSYAPEKWSAAQLVLHLAHDEIGWGNRVRLAVTRDAYVAQPYDGAAWVALETPTPPEVALAAFSALRRLDVALYRRLTPEQRRRPIRHPEFGEISVEWIIGVLAGHDLHHLQHLKAIANR